MTSSRSAIAGRLSLRRAGFDRRAVRAGPIPTTTRHRPRRRDGRSGAAQRRARRPSPPSRSWSTIGRSSLTPASSNSRCSSSALLSWRVCGSVTRSNGRLRLPGIWPRRRPGQVSSALPSKRPAARASTTCSPRRAEIGEDRRLVAHQRGVEAGREMARRDRRRGGLERAPLAPSISAGRHRAGPRCRARRGAASTTPARPRTGRSRRRR